MARILPSTVETPETDPAVIGLEGDGTDSVVSALSSSTARSILSQLYEEPLAPSELADKVGTSLQNTQYHLQKLEDADLVDVADTVYSEKGREMRVYVPAKRPLVVVAGRDEDTSVVKRALTRLLGVVALLAAASLAIQTLLGERSIASWVPGLRFEASNGGVGAQTANADGAIGLPPGLLFFLGGLLVVAVIVAWQVYRTR